MMCLRGLIVKVGTRVTSCEVDDCAFVAMLRMGARPAVVYSYRLGIRFLGVMGARINQRPIARSRPGLLYVE